jgi:hypothetical protein
MVKLCFIAIPSVTVGNSYLSWDKKAEGDLIDSFSALMESVA